MKSKFFVTLALTVSILTGTFAGSAQISETEPLVQYEPATTEIHEEIFTDITDINTITETAPSETMDIPDTQYTDETNSYDDTCGDDTLNNESKEDVSVPPSISVDLSDISITDEYEAELIEDDSRTAEVEKMIIERRRARENEISVTSTSSDDVNSNYLSIFSNLFANKINAAYEAEESDAYVDMSTGSMAANVTDLYIPGKNGLDIKINRTFKTISSPMVEYYGRELDGDTDFVDSYGLSYYCVNENRNLWIYFLNEEEMIEARESFKGNEPYEATSIRTNYYHKLKNTNGEYKYIRNDDDTINKKIKTPHYCADITSTKKESAVWEIYKGWCLQLPQIIKYHTEYAEGSSGNRYYDYYCVFQDRKGHLYSVCVCITRDSDGDKRYSGMHIDGGFGHTIQAVNNEDAEETAIHSQGFEYNLTITDSNGDIYYIYNSANIFDLRGISDRYGNFIRINNASGAYTITDTYGVQYQITQTGINRLDSDSTIELVKYDFQTVNSEFDTDNKYSFDDEYVFTVTKNSGTSDTISENEPNKTTYYMMQKYAYKDTIYNEKTYIYRLPYKVVTPTGLTKNFEYTETTEWAVGYPDCTLPGYYQYVTDYYEQSVDGTDIKNHKEYQYTMIAPGTVNGKYYVGEAVEKIYVGDEILNTTTVTYNSDHLPITEKTEHGNYYIQNEYTYATGEPIGRVSQHIENITGYTNIVNYTYSGYKITSETNGDYVRNYTYHNDNYNLPHTIMYTKDANTTVKVENLLTEDGKSIATQNVYENDVLKSTVNYTYDIYGNVESQSVEREDGTAAITTYAYTYATDGGYTLTATQSGIVDADGSTQSNIVTSQTFDWRGNLISATDANGNTTATTYDLLNRPLTVTYPDTSQEVYTYDMVNNLSTLITESDAKYYATFDDWGNRIKYERGSTNYTNREPLEEYTYDELGQIQSFKRYYNSGDYTLSEYTYDYFYRPKTEKVYDDNNTLLKTTTNTYGVGRYSNNKIYTFVIHNISGDNGTYANYRETYNYLGQLVNTRQISGDVQRTYTYANDYVGNVLSVTDPKGSTTSYTYDYANRPLSETDALGNTKYYTYNTLGLVSSESDYMNNITHYTYDNAGRVLTVTSPFDETGDAFTKYYYDANGNVTRTMVQSDYTSGVTGFDTVDYSYDNMNRIAYTATYPTADTPIYTVYTYSDEGYLQSIVYGNNTPTTTMSDDAARISYLCNIFGVRVAMESPDRVESYSYDYQGRLTRVHLNDADYEVSRYERYTYDDFDNLLTKRAYSNPTSDEINISYTYNVLGQRTSMTDSTGTTGYTYSPFGELTQETKGGIIKAYTYDAVSNRTGFTLTSDGTQQINSSYTYDALNRLTQYSGNGYTASYQYDANSNLIQTTKPDDSVEINTYNLANLLIKRERYVGETLMEQYFYAYYKNSKTASHRNWFEGGEEAGSYNRYFYDGAGRLTRDLRMLAYRYDDEYTYDARGNRIQFVRLDRENGNTTTTTTYTYDKGNKLLTQSDGTDTYAYSYSKFGEMTAVTKNGEAYKNFVYDNLGRLISSTVGDITATYTYDGDNMRQSKTVNGIASNEIYDGANLVAVSKTDGISKYLRGNGLVAYQTPTANGMYDISPAGHVSVTYPLNSDGSANTSAQYQYIYGAFGNCYTQSPMTDIANPFTHNGEVTDSDTGTDLIYLRNRYYDPEIGRFLTVDPAMDGTNWYAYCNNDPVNFEDPLGLISTADGKYSYATQLKLIEHTYAYYDAKFLNNGSPELYAVKASALRIDDNKRSIFDNNSRRVETNILLAKMKAESMGLREGTDEYGIIVLLYTDELNNIDKRGQERYNNILAMYAVASVGKALVNNSNQQGKWSNATFQNDVQYAKHYSKHNKEFGNISKDEYLQGARNLLNAKNGGSIQGFTSKNGSLFKYNTKTNEFAIGSPHGTISTYFKPTDGIDYWIKQINDFK